MLKSLKDFKCCCQYFSQNDLNPSEYNKCSKYWGKSTYFFIKAIYLAWDWNFPDFTYFNLAKVIIYAICAFNSFFLLTQSKKIQHLFFQLATIAVNSHPLGMDVGTKVDWERSASNPVLSQEKVLV